MYNIIKLEKVDSTNKYALESIDLSSIQDFSVVWALEQFAGKGQSSASWESEAGKNLTFSIIVRPEFLPATDQFKITQAVSLGIVNYLKTRLSVDNLKIKWPNDIYIGKKKICGILIHNRIKGSALMVSVIGIGININQDTFGGAPNPVSLKQLTGKDYVLENELDFLLQNVEKKYRLLETGQTKELYSRYLQHLLNYQQEAEYLYLEKKIRATITGVNEFGHLQLQCASGEELECSIKEIRLVV